MKRTTILLTDDLDRLLHQAARRMHRSRAEIVREALTQHEGHTRLMTDYTLNDFDLAALKQDLPAKALLAGDVGTVVFVHDHGHAYEVEFVAANGRTLAVETLRADQIEPFAGQQILHAGRLAEA